MYENQKNNDIKKRIIDIITADKENKSEIIKILSDELKNIEILENDIVKFCNCGYPIAIIKGGNQIWIEEIIKQEVDFRSYKEFYYCPNCNKLLEEFQH
jgi:hypothetical protein